MVRKFRIITIVLSLFIGSVSFAQLAEPGGGDGGAPGDGGIAGGGAPIGSGLILILGMGMAYGAKKTLVLKQDDHN